MTPYIATNNSLHAQRPVSVMTCPHHKVEEQTCYQFQQNRSDSRDQSGDAAQKHHYRQVDNHQNFHLQAGPVVCEFWFASLYLKLRKTIP